MPTLGTISESEGAGTGGGLRILHLEDNLADAELVATQLRRAGLMVDLVVARSKAEFLEQRLQNFDLVLSDCSIPGYDGHSALRMVRELAPSTPFIFVSGTLGEENAIEALKAGATDYVLKDRLGRLVPAVQSALNYATEKRRRMAIEEELRQKAALLDLTDDAVVVLSGSGEIEFWSRGAEALYRWGPSELDSPQIIPALFASVTRWRQITSELADNATWRNELEQRDKGGRLITVDCTLKRAEHGTILFVGRDVTEKKNLERQFLRAQRLESVGILASGIAHDLNNVLTPIILSTEILPNQTNDPVAMQTIQTLRLSANRAAEVVKQLLTFARGCEGKFSRFHPQEVVGEVGRITQRMVSKRVKVQVHPGEPRWEIDGNPTQLHQVLMNLFVNARDALPDKGGQIEISAARVELSPAEAAQCIDGRPGTFIRFSVRDNGSGIPGHVLEHIFEPFFTTKAVGKGTGLGLSTALGIVRSHNGFFQLETEVGKGTCFSFFIPEARTESGLKKAGGEELPGGQAETILVVDDEQGICQMARLVLQIHGYKPVVCDSPETALEVVAKRRGQIQLAIIDFDLPVMNGGELAAAIQKLEPHIQIIFSTGNMEQLGIETLTSRPYAAFLQKPWSIQEFLKAIRAALAQASNG